MLEELTERQQLKVSREAAISKVVDKIIEEDAFIDNCEMVVEQVEE